MNTLRHNDITMCRIDTTLVSDASPEEFLLAKEYDPDAFAKMIMAATQLDIKQKLGGERHLRDIVWNLFKKLNDCYDNRLANLKDNISINGVVNYLGISPHNFNTVGPTRRANHVCRT